MVYGYMCVVPCWPCTIARIHSDMMKDREGLIGIEVMPDTLLGANISLTKALPQVGYGGSRDPVLNEVQGTKDFLKAQSTS